MNTVQPVSSPYADLYLWKSSVSIASNETGSNKATDQVQVLGDSFFCLFGFLGSTNYDNAAGQARAIGVASSGMQLFGPPRVPSNFEVFVTENNTYNLMNQPMPQGALCSSGYLNGKGFPFPILFPPSTTFSFEFYNVAETPLLNVDGDAIALEISFSLYGYNVPTANLGNFCAAWPSFQIEAQKGAAGWLRKFTGINVPGVG